MALVAATFLTALWGFSVAARAAEEGWLVDFAAAKQQAEKEGKDILMEFTGSDWCPPCIALKKKVLDTEVFKTKAPGKFILLKLDSPRDKSKQTMEEIAQYRKLSEEFKIQGVPTIILADSKGRPYARTVGYGGQSPEDYVAKLESEQGARTKRDEAFAKAEKAEGVERAKLLDEGLAVVDSELAVAQYRDIVDQIVKLDASNEGGLKGKYESLLTLGELRGSLQEIVRSYATAGPEETLKKIEALIETRKPEGAALQEALVLKGQVLFQMDKAKSKEAFEAAQKVAPNSDVARQIAQFLKSQFRDEPKEDGSEKPESDGDKKGAEKK